MKRIHSFLHTVSLTGAICAAAWMMLLACPIPEALAEQDQQASPCVVATQQLVNPPVLLLGEDVEVQLGLRATCPFTSPRHIALVIDSSSSMSGAREASMKQAVKGFLQGLNLSRNSSNLVGIAQFDDTAITLCQLTNDMARLSNCVDSIHGLGGSASDRGITQGLSILRQGRHLTHPREVIILLTDGPTAGPIESGCPPLLQAAARAKSQGVLVVTVGVGQDYDAACLRQAATSPRFFYQSLDENQLAQSMDQVRESIVNEVLASLWAEIELPANMELIPDSIFPPAILSTDYRTLSWRAISVPTSGITLTYRIRPLEPGTHPVMLRSSIQFHDSASQTGIAAFPQRLLSVMQALLPPTPVAP